MSLPYSRKKSTANNLEFRDVRKFEIKSLHIHDRHILSKQLSLQQEVIYEYRCPARQ